MAARWGFSPHTFAFTDTPGRARKRIASIPKAIIAHRLQVVKSTKVPGHCRGQMHLRPRGPLPTRRERTSGEWAPPKGWALLSVAPTPWAERSPSIATHPVALRLPREPSAPFDAPVGRCYHPQWAATRWAQRRSHDSTRTVARPCRPTLPTPQGRSGTLRHGEAESFMAKCACGLPIGAWPPGARGAQHGPKPTLSRPNGTALLQHVPAG